MLPSPASVKTLNLLGGAPWGLQATFGLGDGAFCFPVGVKPVSGSRTELQADFFKSHICICEMYVVGEGRDVFTVPENDGHSLY